jgi:rhodanese-related sulfurtransferase
MLAKARTRIRRYTPEEAAADEEILIVDLRSADERERTGVIPGSKHVRYSVIQWRADPTSEWRYQEGYSSSLAAASLVDIGVDAGDLIGGSDAW